MNENNKHQVNFLYTDFIVTQALFGYCFFYSSTMSMQKNSFSCCAVHLHCITKVHFMLFALVFHAMTAIQL